MQNFKQSVLHRHLARPSIQRALRTVTLGVLVLSAGQSLGLKAAHAQGQTLKAAVQDYNTQTGCSVLVGGVIKERQLEKGEAAYDNTVKAHYNLTGDEGALKFKSVHPDQGVYNWAPADHVVQFAKENGMKVRGHTLVWHSSVPSWLNGKTSSQLNAILQDHISTVMTRYKSSSGRPVYLWDVTNEMVDEFGIMRSNIWHKAPGFGAPAVNISNGSGQTINIGSIVQAHKWARDADPGALLFYNDYDTEELTSPKTKAVLEIAKKLRSISYGGRALLDGVGFQMHIGNGDASQFAATAKAFAATGAQVQITELDSGVYMGAVDRTVTANAEFSRLLSQADKYHEAAVNSLYAGDKLTAFQTWGFTDKYSWIAEKPDSDYGAALPFADTVDNSGYYNKKPAFYAIRQAFDQQAEVMPVSSSPSGLTVDFSDSEMSGQKGNFVMATAASQSVTYTLALPEPGTYVVNVKVKRGPDRGICRLDVINPATGFVSAKDTEDLWFSDYDYKTLYFGTLTVDSASAGQTRQFRFTVTGKLSSSAGYKLAFDWIYLKRQS